MTYVEPKVTKPQHRLLTVYIFPGFGLDPTYSALAATDQLALRWPGDNCASGLRQGLSRGLGVDLKHAERSCLGDCERRIWLSYVLCPPRSPRCSLSRSARTFRGGPAARWAARSRPAAAPPDPSSAAPAHASRRRWPHCRAETRHVSILRRALLTP